MFWIPIFSLEMFSLGERRVQGLVGTGPEKPLGVRMEQRGREPSSSAGSLGELGLAT